MAISLLLARRTEALTVKNTVSITCTSLSRNSQQSSALRASRFAAPACETSPACDVTPRGTVMAATFNPQAAADQARNAYRNVTAQLGLLALDTAIPEAVGALAEKTVDQTREAYDRSKDALEASI